MVLVGKAKLSAVRIKLSKEGDGRSIIAEREFAMSIVKAVSTCGHIQRCMLSGSCAKGFGLVWSRAILGVVCIGNEAIEGGNVMV